jgi:hypothetical protein
MYWGSSVICMSVYYIEQYIWIAPDYITSSCNPTVQLELAGGGGDFAGRPAADQLVPVIKIRLKLSCHHVFPSLDQHW